MRSLHRWLVPFIVIASVIWGVAIFLDLAPWLRGPAGWRWALGPSTTASRLAASAVAALLFWVGWWALGRWLRSGSRRVRPWLALFSLLALALLLQVSLLNLWPATRGQYSPVAVLFERLASDQASGYFTVAQEIEHLPTFLRDYPERMPGFRPDPHPRSKPPGIVVAYWLVERLLERVPSLSGQLGMWGRGVCCDRLWLVGLSDAALASNTVMALAIPLLSALAVIPAYRLASRHSGLRAGWLAAGLVAVMPGRLAFIPHMDIVYPFLALLALDFLDMGIERNHTRWTLVSGLVIGIATFFSLVNGLIAALAGLWLLFRLGRHRGALWSPPLLRHAAALAAGAGALWFVYWFATSVTPFAIYHAAAPARHDLQRRYWVWLGANLADFALFAGVPALVLALPRRGDRDSRAMASLVAAFWLVFLALDFSGMIRGEVGRIWLMLAPVPALLAVRRPAATGAATAPALLAATLFLAWSVNARWEVTRLEWPRQPQQTATVITTLPQTATDVPFGPAITLGGYDLAVSATLDLTLYWKAVARPQVPYAVFVHVVAPDGTIAAQQDVMPQNGTILTTCWQEGDLIVDAHRLAIDALSPGVYDILVGLYDQATATRPAGPLLVGQLEVTATQNAVRLP